LAGAGPAVGERWPAGERWPLGGLAGDSERGGLGGCRVGRGTLVTCGAAMERGAVVGIGADVGAAGRGAGDGLGEGRRGDGPAGGCSTADETGGETGGEPAGAVDRAVEGGRGSVGGGVVGIGAYDGTGAGGPV
jgi:hypothetical protein